MDTHGLTPILRRLSGLVVLLLIVSPAGAGPAAAAKEECQPDREARAFQCLWDQEDFEGNMKPLRPSDLAGLCIHFPIRSAANNGTSGTYTLYLYEQGNCAGDSVSKLNAGEAVRSVRARSARFAPKDAYR